LALFPFTLAASLIVESVYALDEMQRHAVKTTEVSGNDEAIYRPDSLSASNSGFIIPVLTRRATFRNASKRRISKSSSSRRVTRLVLVFILETDNRTNYEMFAEARPDG